MSNLRQAAQQALEALEAVNNESLWWGKKDAAITALRAALAEPEQEQCACGDRQKTQCPGEWEPGCDLGNNAAHVRVHQPTPEELAEPEQPVACSNTFSCRCPKHFNSPTPRRPLTDEEIERLWFDQWDGFVSFEKAAVIARAVEWAHGITGEQT